MKQHRVTASLPNRSSSLDLLRTLAIVLVFTSHFRIFASNEWFSTVGTFGWAGVDLFFVLSGFLIASQLFREVSTDHSLSFKRFYLRRGFRIWPSYLVVLALYFCFPILSERSHLPPLWKFLTFTQNFGLDYRTEGEFSHAWSLCVEEHFYLVFPVLAVLIVRYFNLKKSILAFMSVLAVGILLRATLWPGTQGDGALFYRDIYYPTYCRLDGLTVGVAIAALYRLTPALWKTLSRYANLSFIMGMIGILASYQLCLDHYSWQAAVFGFPLIALSFGALVFSAVATEGFFSKVRIPFVKTGATLAFSFYLTHKSAIHFGKAWVEKLGIPGASVFYPLGIFSVCLTFSAALYLLIEKPGLRLRDRFTQ